MHCAEWARSATEMSDPRSKKGPNRTELAKCFKVLGLAGYAKDQEVRRAYRLLVLREHPDKGGDQAKFQEIQKAYDTLLNKESAYLYNIPPRNIVSNCLIHATMTW